MSRDANIAYAGSGQRSRLGTYMMRIVKHLLAPPSKICPICTRQSPQVNADVLLCPSCAGKISWIERPMCIRCGREQVCPDCRQMGHTPHYLIRNRSAVNYSEEMKAWLGRYKYQGDEQLAALFGRMLHHAWQLLEQSPQRRAGLPDMISYIPLSSERLTERGFNQAEQMALAWAAQLKCPAAPLLVRTRHGARLSSQSRQARKISTEGAFGVHPSAVTFLSQAYSRAVVKRGRSERGQPFPLRIVLVDDVYTTGSTLHQASATLIRQFPDIWLEIESMTWARA